MWDSQDVRENESPSGKEAAVTVSVVVSPERRTKPGMMPSLVNPEWSTGSPSVEGLYAEVRVAGATFCVSQMPGETDWTVDAMVPPGSSCPAWSNGFGARYLRTKVLSAEVAAVLDAEVTTNDFCAEMADPS